MIFIALMTLWSCDKDDSSPMAGYRFIAMHMNEESRNESYFSLVRIRSGEPEFTRMSDVLYPFDADRWPYNMDSRWRSRLNQHNGRLGFTLPRGLSEHVGDNTKWTGGWMEMMDGIIHELPFLDPCIDFGYDPGCNRYSYTSQHSIRIGECGNIFYLAMSAYEAGMWHDEPRYRLIKYNPGSGNYQVSPLISNWTLSQPEVDASRYGLGRIGDNIFPSSCGQYVYGRTAGWGISGGSLIASRGILFRYDFDKEEFSRVESVAYGFDPYFITANNRYIYYTNQPERDRNVVDLRTGNVWTLENSMGNMTNFQTGINDDGILGTAFPLMEFYYLNIVEDERTAVPIPSHITDLQFSADGTYAYFRYRSSDKNYLLRTALSEEATVDTVAVLPDNVRVMPIL